MPLWNFTFTRLRGSAYALNPKKTMDINSCSLQNSFINISSTNPNLEETNNSGMIWGWDDFNKSISNSPFTWDNDKYLSLYLIGYSGTMKETYHDKNTMDDSRKITPQDYYKVRLYTTDFSSSMYVGISQFLTIRSNVSTTGILVPQVGSSSRVRDEGLFHRYGLVCSGTGVMTLPNGKCDFNRFTWSCFVNVDNWTTTTGFIWSAGNQANRGWYLELGSNNLTLSMYDSAVGINQVVHDISGYTGWGHIVVRVSVEDGNEIGRLYFNGVSVGSYDFTAGGFAFEPPFTDTPVLSGDNTLGNTIDGSYDCLIYYKDDDSNNFSDAMIRSLYNNRKGNCGQGYNHTDNTCLLPFFEFQFEDHEYSVAQGFPNQTYSRTKWSAEFENISLSYKVN